MYVEISFPNNVMQILDPHIVPRDKEAAIEYGSNWNHMSRIETCLFDGATESKNEYSGCH